MNRKGHTNTLVIASVIIGLGVTGLMYGLPGMIGDDVETIIRSNSVFLKADTITNTIEEDYTFNAVNWSFYQSSYEFGETTAPAVKKWDQEFVPDAVNMNESLLSWARVDLRGDYFHSSDVDIPTECEFESDWFEFKTKNITDEKDNDIEGVNFTARSEDPMKIRCQKDRARVEEYMAPNVSVYSAQNRFFYLYNTSVHLANATGFRNVTADILRKSSNFTVARNTENVGYCTSDTCSELDTRIADLRDWADVKDDFENEQSDRAHDDLQEELNDWINGTGKYHGFIEDFRDLDDRYENLNVSVEDVRVEYDVVEKTQLSEDDEKGDGWRVSGCYRSCDVLRGPDNTWTCSDDCSGVDSPDPASTDGLCPADASPGTNHCSTSSWDYPDNETGIPGLWTEDPWELDDGEVHGNNPVSIFSGMSAITIAPDERVRGGSHPLSESHDTSDLCDDPPDCDASDTSRCGGCDYNHRTENNGVEQTTRRIWQIDKLNATTRVTIVAKDYEYTIPTDEGFEPLVFKATYEQEQTWDFEGGYTSVNYPEGSFDCTDADFYGRYC